MLSQLMNKDSVVAEFDESREIEDFHYAMHGEPQGRLPYDFTTIDSWIDDRKVASHRQPIKRQMRQLDMTSRHDFIGMARCLSLTDTYCMKRPDEDVS